MKIGETVIINSRKFDGAINKTWKAKLVRSEATLLVFAGFFEKEVNHQDLGIIRRGTISYEYYWLDKWFSIFHFQESDGTFRNFYCNINMPPTFKENTLNYIDLDIDILVEKDFSYKILDRHEFDHNSLIYKYPQEIILQTQIVLDELQQMILKKDFPFSEICKKPLTD